jgi:hypothetical protein
MASIPLPALATNTQGPSPLDQYAKLLQIRNAQAQQPLIQGQQQLQQQQIQQGQFAVQDREAGLKAMQQWDAKDPNELPDLIRQNGGSMQAVLGARDAITKQQQAVAQLNEAQLNVAKTKNDYLLGKLQAATDPSVPDEQLPQTVMQAANDSVKAGYLDPQHAQGLQQIAQQFQSDPAGLRSHLALFEKSLQSQSEQFAQAQKAKETEAAQQTAQSRVTEANTNAQKFQAELPGGPLNKVTQETQIATNPQIQQGKIAVATAEGQARANVEAQMARGANAALAQVPPHLIAPATEAATKAGTDYAQAESVSQRLNAMMDAAKKGNVVSYQLLPEEGALQVTTSQGVHRINMAEIQNYGGGSLWQNMQGHFGKALTGKSIPDSVLNDMAEMQKVQADGAKQKYADTLKTINQNYGSNFQPVAGGASQTATVGLPSVGDTVTIKGKQMKVTAVHPDGSFDAK